jgi:hypothetical protein
MFYGKANDSARNQARSLLLHGQDWMLHGTLLCDKRRNLWAYFDLCGGTAYNPKTHVFLEAAMKNCGYKMSLSSLWHHLHGKPRSLCGNPIVCGWDFQRSTNHPNDKKHILMEGLHRCHFHGIRNTLPNDVFLSKEIQYGRM